MIVKKDKEVKFPPIPLFPQSRHEKKYKYKKSFHTHIYI